MDKTNKLSHIKNCKPATKTNLWIIWSSQLRVPISTEGKPFLEIITQPRASRIFSLKSSSFQSETDPQIVQLLRLAATGYSDMLKTIDGNLIL